MSSTVSPSSLCHISMLFWRISSHAASMSPLSLWCLTISRTSAFSRNSQTPSLATIKNWSSLFSVYSRISVRLDKNCDSYLVPKLLLQMLRPNLRCSCSSQVRVCPNPGARPGTGQGAPLLLHHHSGSSKAQLCPLPL